MTYVSVKYQSSIYNQKMEDSRIELLWIMLENGGRRVIVGAVYHPPKPIYNEQDLLLQLEQVMAAVHHDHGDTKIVKTGDFNQLKDSSLRLLGLFKEETEATRAGHHLDRVYTSEPMYRNISVIVPTVKTDHKAIYASAIDYDTHRPPKNKAKLKCRLHRPAQHAAYLAAFSKTRQEEDTNSDFVFDVDGGATPPSLQESFDRFYLQMQRLLDRFYPIRNITVTDRDPPYITPEIKLLLRKKMD